MTLLSSEDYCIIGYEEEKKNVLIRVMVTKLFDHLLR